MRRRVRTRTVRKNTMGPLITLLFVFADFIAITTCPPPSLFRV